MSFLRGAALVCLLFTVLAGLVAYQALAVVTDTHGLREASGQVGYTRASLNISGAKFKVTSRKLLFRLDTSPIVFVYPSGLPNFDRVSDAVQRGRTVGVLYRNCHEMTRKTRCEVMQVSQSGAKIVSLDEVLDHLTDDVIFYSIIAMLCGIAAVGFFTVDLRTRPVMPDPRDYRRWR